MKKNRKLKKSFTIIELIVVIAVISVLSTIVLIKINSIRSKSKDAAIKQDMESFFVLSLEYFQQHEDDYGGFCNYDPVIRLFENLPAYDNVKTKQCSADSDDWVICSKLNFPEDRSSAWCIDNSGVKYEITAEQCEYLKNGLGENKVCPR
jgi:prepilin-type N-terminal cleavage/methylation domain-containing protein